MIYILLTDFSPMFHFSIPLKRQKASGFLKFSGGIEMERGREMGKDKFHCLLIRLDHFLKQPLNFK